MRLRDAVPAKISRPVVQGVERRARLFRALDRARHRPITWVSGPAGCGKTTLVASYVAARRLPCLWYMADAGDGDVATLFYYLRAAARRLAPIAARRLPLWSADRPANLPVFSRRYFEALYECLPPKSVLVFDDCHEGEGSDPFQEALREGLAVVPARINVLALSRHDPPPSLARLLAGGAVSQLGWKDLRLSVTETVAVARRRLGTGARRLPPRSLARLHALTDGWAAGLVLLLESERGDFGESRSLRGKAPRAVFDYFASEVFARSEPRLREFLVSTAYLPTMSAALAERLTGMPDAGRTLERLSRDGFFTERCGRGEGTFRYHALFRQFLLDRAADVLRPGLLTAIRRKAAAALVDEDQLHEALALFKVDGDVAAITDAIIERAPGLVAQGRIETLRALLAAVPAGDVEKRSWLLYWKAACTLGYEPSGALALFTAAYERFRGEDDVVGTYLAWAGAVQAIVYESDCFYPLDVWIEKLETLQRDRPGFPSPAVESRVAAAVVMARAHRGQFGQGRPWAERALALSMQQPDAAHRLQAAALVLKYRSFTGDLAGAAPLVPSLEKALVDESGDPLARVAVALGLADYHVATGELTRSVQAAEAGLALAERTGLQAVHPELRAHAACGAILAGDRSRYERWASVPRAGATSMEAGSLYFSLGVCALLDGDLGESLRLQLQAAPIADRAGLGYALVLSKMFLARTLQELGKPVEARAYIDGADALAEEMQSALYVHWIVTVRLHIALETGAVAEAREVARRVFAFGRAHGLLAAPWQLSRGAFAAVCAFALAEGIEREHVCALIAANDLEPPVNGDVDLAAWPWAIRVTTLGRFDVSGQGRSLLRSRKLAQTPLRLLKVLVAFGGDEVSQERLADALWPDADGDAGARNLDTSLHRLRKLLGRHDAIEMRAGTLTLNRRVCQVDAFALEDLCRQIERPIAQEGFERLAERLFGIYDGPFLPAEREGLWTDRARDNFRGLFTSALLALADSEVARGRSEVAGSLLRRGIAIDDLAEPLRHKLAACDAAPVESGARAAVTIS